MGALLGRNDLFLTSVLLGCSGSQSDTAVDGRNFTSGMTFTGLTMDSQSDVDWFSFQLSANTAANARLELASGSPIDNLRIDLYPASADVSNPANRLNAPSFAALGNLSSISLANLVGGTKYLVKITSPNQVPTIYDLLRLNLDGITGIPTQLAAFPRAYFSVSSNMERRDILIGGMVTTYSKVAQVRTGGSVTRATMCSPAVTIARRAICSSAVATTIPSEYLPDALPLLGNQPNTQFDPATKTYLTTQSDQFIGGEGNDRVLFLGGDKDRNGFDVPIMPRCEL